MVDMVIYHGGCHDGFCAAFLFWKKYPNAEFIPAFHNSPTVPDVAGRDVVIVDFSYKRLTLIEMHSKAKRLIVLDHHKSAAAELEGLDFCTFDMQKSGARLAWEWLRKEEGLTIHPWSFIPWFVSYIEDRDLWKWELPHSRDVNANIRSWPMAFEVWDDLFNTDDFELSQAPYDFTLHGMAILRDQANTVAAKVKQSHSVVLGGIVWNVCNATTLVSETAEALLRDFTDAIGCCWFEHPDGSRTYSLRSSARSHIDVSQIALRYGGGGHLHAAGFTIPPGNPHPWGGVNRGTAYRALLAVQDVIEATYSHDEDGERDEDAEPDHSAADIVEMLCGIDVLVDEAIAELEQSGV